MELDVTSLETIELRILRGVHTADGARGDVEVTTEGAGGRAVDNTTSGDTHEGAVNHVDVIDDLAGLGEDLACLVLLGGNGGVVELGHLGVLGTVSSVVETGNAGGKLAHGELVHGSLGSHTGLGGRGGKLKALRILSLDGDIVLVGIETVARLGGGSEGDLLSLTVVEGGTDGVGELEVLNTDEVLVIKDVNGLDAGGGDAGIVLEALGALLVHVGVDGAAGGDGSVLALEVGVGTVHVGIALGAVHGISHATSIKRSDCAVYSSDHTLGEVVLNDFLVLTISVQGISGGNRKSWDCNLIKHFITTVKKKKLSSLTSIIPRFIFLSKNTPLPISSPHSTL